ncbi:hypothetical protein QQF64_023723 [Cirrhinus molitorella]|uniref:Uncharacterized protein n=1 Tax=Cirrhinus molitorella TaxID=172907 RepID=A0ABR3NJ72_9TELE
MEVDLLRSNSTSHGPSPESLTELNSVITHLHLVDPIQEGLQQHFGNMLVEPKFKTSWTLDEQSIKLGLDYIKEETLSHQLMVPVALRMRTSLQA